MRLDLTTISHAGMNKVLDLLPYIAVDIELNQILIDFMNYYNFWQIGSYQAGSPGSVSV